MKNLDPKAVWFFFLSNIVSVFILLAWLSFMVFGAIASDTESALSMRFGLLASIIAVLALIIDYVIARLTYRFYKYELREDCFRKESGIIWKRYVSIPYERIQNVDIHRGVFARILGLSDLQIQTAGSSAVVYRGVAAGGVGAEGRLPGISSADAEILRDELVKRARGMRVQQGV